MAETVAVRESFLQAADFVGREAKFNRLNDALKIALAGLDSGWLVGGESGVGKSRLLDELRTQALVEGGLFYGVKQLAMGPRLTNSGDMLSGGFAWKVT